MGIRELPLAVRIEAVRAIFTPLTERFAAGITTIGERPGNNSGSTHPVESVALLLQRAKIQRLEIASRHYSEWTDLWRKTVSDTRKQCGDDAVNPVLKQLMVV